MRIVPKSKVETRQRNSISIVRCFFLPPSPASLLIVCDCFGDRIWWADGEMVLVALLATFRRMNDNVRLEKMGKWRKVVIHCTDRKSVV